MLTLLLVSLLGLCAGQPFQFLVSIDYHDPALTIRVNVNSSDISSVIFKYWVGIHNYNGRGTRTGDHYELHAQLRTNITDVIHASAEIHYSTGLIVTTPQVSHLVADPGGDAPVPLGHLRVRGVIFRDDFNDYNRNNWRPEISMFGGMNWEFQVYTPEAKNIYASGGSLYLRPTLTSDDPRWSENFLHTGVLDVAQVWGSCTNSGNWGCNRDGHNGLLPPVMSGKVMSNPSIRYGSVEVRARIPRGDWLWPAIWMLPRDSVYGGWPRSGEIDIMESRGNDGDLGVNTVSSTLHWGPAWDQNRWDLTHGERTAGNFHNDFHTWRLDWTTDYLRTFVDNNQILNADVGAGFWAKGGFGGSSIWPSRTAPFDQDFFLILNNAVGGTNGFFGDGSPWPTRKPWANNSPHAADDFWNGRNDWLPSWQGDNAALVVDYVEFRN